MKRQRSIYMEFYTHDMNTVEINGDVTMRDDQPKREERATQLMEAGH